MRTTYHRCQDARRLARKLGCKYTYLNGMYVILAPGLASEGTQLQLELFNPERGTDEINKAKCNGSSD